MNAEHLTLEKHLKKTTFVSNILSVFVALTTALSVGYGFYYNTQNTLETHTKTIDKLQTDFSTVQTKINENAVFQGVSQSEMLSLQDKVNDISTRMEKMDEKLDRILIQGR